MKKSPACCSCIEMMRVRGCAPGDEDERGHSVQAVKKSVPLLDTEGA